jgi:hypothetical protein
MACAEAGRSGQKRSWNENAPPGIEMVTGLGGRRVVWWHERASTTLGLATFRRPHSPVLRAVARASGRRAVRCHATTASRRLVRSKQHRRGTRALGPKGTTSLLRRCSEQPCGSGLHHRQPRADLQARRSSSRAGREASPGNHGGGLHLPTTSATLARFLPASARSCLLLPASARLCPLLPAPARSCPLLPAPARSPATFPPSHTSK